MADEPSRPMLSRLWVKLAAGLAVIAFAVFQAFIEGAITATGLKDDFFGTVARFGWWLIDLATTQWAFYLYSFVVGYVAHAAIRALKAPSAEALLNQELTGIGARLYNLGIAIDRQARAGGAEFLGVEIGAHLRAEASSLALMLEAKHGVSMQWLTRDLSTAYRPDDYKDLARRLVTSGKLFYDGQIEHGLGSLRYYGENA